MDKKLLLQSEIFFKLAFAIHKSIPIKLNYLDQFSWGKHMVERKNLVLTTKEEKTAIGLLHHIATYIIAVQIDTYLQNKYPNRFNNADSSLKSSALIARLLRNAFSHNPFNPV